MKTLMILRMLGFFKCFAFSCEWSRVESSRLNVSIRRLGHYTLITHGWMKLFCGIPHWSLQDLGLSPDVDWIGIYPRGIKIIGILTH